MQEDIFTIDRFSRNSRDFFSRIWGLFAIFFAETNDFDCYALPETLRDGYKFKRLQYNVLKAAKQFSLISVFYRVSLSSTGHLKI